MHLYLTQTIMMFLNIWVIRLFSFFFFWKIVRLVKVKNSLEVLKLTAELFWYAGWSDLIFRSYSRMHLYHLAPGDSGKAALIELKENKCLAFTPWGSIRLHWHFARCLDLWFRSSLCRMVSSEGNWLQSSCARYSGLTCAFLVSLPEITKITRKWPIFLVNSTYLCRHFYNTVCLSS